MKNLKCLVFIILAAAVVFIGGAASAKAQSDPTPQQTNEWRTRGTCNDPWVSLAVSSFAYGGTALAQTSNGADGECDVSQYNGGRWGNFAELVKAMDKARADLRAAGMQWESYKIGSSAKALFLVKSDGNIMLGIVAQGGGNLISQDGASLKNLIARIVAQGGGNIVAQGGGNLVLNDLKSAGIVSQGGGNLISGGALSAVQSAKLSNFIPSRVIAAIKPAGYSVLSSNDAVRVGSVYYVLTK